MTGGKAGALRERPQILATRMPAGAAAHRGFHRVGPAGIGPRAGDRDGRDATCVARCARAEARQPRRFGIARHGAGEQRRSAQCRNERSAPRATRALRARRRHPQVLVGGAEAAAQIARRLFRRSTAAASRARRRNRGRCFRRRATDERRRSDTARTRRGSRCRSAMRRPRHARDLARRHAPARRRRSRRTLDRRAGSGNVTPPPAPSRIER